MVTEEQLVVSAQKGSVEAFGQLVEMYQQSLLRFMLLRCGNRADAEDAVQEAFVNAYRYIGSYDRRWKFSTWLFRIALRNASKSGELAALQGRDAPEPVVDPLEACVIASDRENLWLTARRILHADAYAAMWLRYAEDMPVKDVARALEKPLTWTKVTLMRSRRRLAAELTGAARASTDGEAYG